MKLFAWIIYIVLSIFFGPMWPIEMFFRAGLLGVIIVLAWVALVLC